MNRNAPDLKPAGNVSDGSRQCVSLNGKKTSPQINMNKSSATNSVDAILINSTIPGQLINNYSTQVKTGRNMSTKDLYQL